MSRLLMALLMSVFAWHPASAHLMPEGRGTVNVVGGKAYVVAALPVRAFERITPAAADGALTAAERTTHQAALRAAVRAGIQLSVAGAPARVGRVLLDGPQGGGHLHQGTITAMLVVHLPPTAGPLEVRNTLWAGEAATLELEATVTEGGAVVRREVQRLSPAAPSHTFFAGAPAAPAADHHHPHHHGDGGHSH